MQSLNSLLARLFRSYHDELVRFATRLVGDRDVGEEVAQEAYVRIAARSDGAAIAYPKTYLFTAARNTAIDVSASRRLEASRRADFDEALSLANDHDAAEALHHRRKLAQLSVALNELPSACRTTFLLNRVHGMRHKEIARRLGVSVSMVEKHMMRALAHCRDVARENDAS